MSDFSNYNVLVIEDTPEVAQITMMTLKRLGFTSSFHASHGEEAVAYFEHTRPDVVLLDLNLPGMSGWEVTEAMHDKFGRGIPIIVTTAYGDNTNRVVGKLHDVYKYLIKPFSPNDLGDALGGALGIPA